MVGDGVCVHVGDVDCVDEWLEVIEDLEGMQVVDVDYVEEGLDLKEGVDCMRVDVVDCSCILDVDLQC